MLFSTAACNVETVNNAPYEKEKKQAAVTVEKNADASLSQKENSGTEDKYTGTFKETEEKPLEQTEKTLNSADENGSTSYEGAISNTAGKSKTGMTIELTEGVYNAKLNIGDDAGNKDISTGEYTVAFDASGIKTSGENSVVTASAQGTGGAFDVIIIFTEGDDTAVNATV
ncbi:MAG: hypothetical protein IJR47_05290, partial [Clostridia bacterium]|nr:hypothetical protein [Clostridia bacterium]